MRLLILALTLLSCSYASSVDTIIKNYPFSPDRKYAPMRQEKVKLEDVPILGYIINGKKTYLLVRNEGKVRKLNLGEELSGMKVIGVGKGGMVLRRGDEVVKVKIKWERSQSPIRSRNEEAGQKPDTQQAPPKGLMDLLQERR